MRHSEIDRRSGIISNQLSSFTISSIILSGKHLLVYTFPSTLSNGDAVSVTRLSCFVDSLGPFVLLTCYHGGRFCRTDIVEDHKRLITINNYFSQDWNDFNLAVRISSLRFSFGRDWNDKFQLRCSNDKFQLRCSNSTESDQSHARRPEDRNCHPVDRGRLRIPKHITNEMHEWVKTLGWGRIGSLGPYRVAMIKTGAV